MEIIRLNKDRLFFTNCYLITNGTNDCILVDPGLNFKEEASLIQNKYNVKAIFLTHGHLDHIDGIRYFNCPIYINELDYEFLSNPSLSLYQQMGKIIPLFNGDIRTFKNNDIFEIIGLKLKVIHTPGHTRGSVCFLINNYLFSGDTLFQNSYGRCDFPTGSLNEMLKSFRRLSLLDDNIIVYPGHGDETTIAEEKKYNELMKSISL